MQPADSWVIPIEPTPFQPWLRLAHLSVQRNQRAGDRLPVRVLADFEWVLQIEGESLVWSEPEQRWHAVRAGDLLFIPPGYPHAWGGRPGSHLAVHFDLHARPDWGIKQTITTRVTRTPPSPAVLPEAGRVPVFFLTCEGRGLPVALPLRMRLASWAPWQDRFEQLVRLHATGGARTVPGAWECAAIIGWALHGLEALQRGSAPAVSRNRERVTTLLERLATEPHLGKLGVEQLAAQAGMGLTAFRQLFTEATGQTPRVYLERTRMEHAARLLLEGGLSIREIGEQAGYDDPFHFSRVFRRVHGIPPRAWREAARNSS